MWLIHPDHHNVGSLTNILDKMDPEQYLLVKDNYLPVVVRMQHRMAALEVIVRDERYRVRSFSPKVHLSSLIRRYCYRDEDEDISEEEYKAYKSVAQLLINFSDKYFEDKCYYIAFCDYVSSEDCEEYIDHLLLSAFLVGDKSGLSSDITKHIVKHLVNVYKL